MPEMRSGVASFCRAIGLLIACINLMPVVKAQALSSDSVDFTTTEGWLNFPECTKGIFSGNGPLRWGQNGCSTNTCLCSRSNLELGITETQDLALFACSNLDDQMAAKTILIEYCSAHGFTGPVTGVIPPFIGALIVIVIVEQTVIIMPASKSIPDAIDLTSSVP